MEPNIQRRHGLTSFFTAISKQARTWINRWLCAAWYQHDTNLHVVAMQRFHGAFVSRLYVFPVTRVSQRHGTDRLSSPISCTRAPRRQRPWASVPSGVVVVLSKLMLHVFRSSTSAACCQKHRGMECSVTQSQAFEGGQRISLMRVKVLLTFFFRP